MWCSSDSSLGGLLSFKQRIQSETAVERSAEKMELNGVHNAITDSFLERDRLRSELNEEKQKPSEAASSLALISRALLLSNCDGMKVTG